MKAHCTQRRRLKTPFLSVQTVAAFMSAITMSRTSSQAMNIARAATMNCSPFVTYAEKSFIETTPIGMSGESKAYVKIASSGIITHATIATA
jgi:hypothetical protein